MSAGSATRPRVAVLVSGHGSNLQAIIERCNGPRGGIQLVGVISDRPEAFALERARRAGVAAITVNYRAAPDRDEFARRLAMELDRLRPELVALAGFMRILPAELVNHYRGRMLNVHPSLLPKYPGLDTYRRVLDSGDEWHGSTVHYVTPDLDTGPAIVQYRLRVGPTDTADSLRVRIQRGEHRIYPQTINWIAAGRISLRQNQVFMDGKALAEPLVIDEEPE